MSEPIVCLTLGDMNGVGPEVGLRSLAGSEVPAVVIADRFLLERAADQLGFTEALALFDPDSGERPLPGRLNFVDTGTGAGRHCVPGSPSRQAGIETVVALDIAFSLARTGRVGASVMGPVNSDSIGLSGLRTTAMDPAVGAFYLFLASGSLRIAHLTDHMPLVDVCTREVKQDRIERLISTIHESFGVWGVPSARIAVAGLNPHCRGAEEREEIEPAVQWARRAGIQVTGPVSPDSVFRECIDGRYDVVAAMYHDQGHIALKSWGFSAGTTVFMGLPFLHLTVAHGSAYDIAWQGRADPSPMAAALRLAHSLAAGRGFCQ
jgi:4-hydroxythreonine-4-phosphate dehydrogenase